MQVAGTTACAPGACSPSPTSFADGRVRADFEHVEEMGLALGETAWTALASAGRLARRAVGDGQALLRPRRRLVARARPLHGRPQDRVRARPGVPRAGPRARQARPRPRASRPISRSSRRSTASSMPSSRCETERSRRVSRSMSAADGMPSAPMAASCACAALSRASNARASAALTTGFATSSSATLPRASSPCRDRRSFSPSSVGSGTARKLPDRAHREPYLDLGSRVASSPRRVAARGRHALQVDCPLGVGFPQED